MKTARPSSWKTIEMPSSSTTVALDRVFSQQDMTRVRKGFKPGHMGDHWSMYWKDNKLFCHRSWTGYCIYIVSFIKDGKNWKMVEVVVNRDNEQYGMTDDSYDIKMISWLIDFLLLEIEGEYPQIGA